MQAVVVDGAVDHARREPDHVPGRELLDGRAGVVEGLQSAATADDDIGLGAGQVHVRRATVLAVGGRPGVGGQVADPDRPRELRTGGSGRSQRELGGYRLQAGAIGRPVDEHEPVAQFQTLPGFELDLLVERRRGVQAGERLAAGEPLERHGGRGRAGVGQDRRAPVDLVVLPADRGPRAAGAHDLVGPVTLGDDRCTGEGARAAPEQAGVPGIGPAVGGRAAQFQGLGVRVGQRGCEVEGPDAPTGVGAVEPQGAGFGEPDLVGGGRSSPAARPRWPSAPSASSRSKPGAAGCRCCRAIRSRVRERRPRSSARPRSSGPTRATSVICSPLCQRWSHGRNTPSGAPDRVRSGWR